MLMTSVITMMRGTIGGCGRRHAAMQHENGSMQRRTEALDARRYRQLHRTLWSDAMRIGPSHPPPPGTPCARVCLCVRLNPPCVRERERQTAVFCLCHCARTCAAAPDACPCAQVLVPVWISRRRCIDLVAVGPHSAQQSCVAHTAASGESVPVATAYC